jgi:hypothetical protein
MDDGTREHVDLPADRAVVNNMLINKIKLDREGDVAHYKARFVAKGCSKRACLDYIETFFPVIRMASFRLFLAIAAAIDLKLWHIGIDTTLLFAPSKRM